MQCPLSQQSGPVTSQQGSPQGSRLAMQSRGTSAGGVAEQHLGHGAGEFG